MQYHNHPNSLIKFKNIYYYFKFCKCNEFFDDCLPFCTASQQRTPIKIRGRRSGSAGPHKLYSDMMLKCLESLHCIMTSKDLHFLQEDNLCVYMEIQRLPCTGSLAVTLYREQAYACHGGL